MIDLKCINKFRDSYGNISSYRLLSRTGEIFDLDSDELKDNIRNKKVNVVNLKLTLNNRLIDRKNALKDKSYSKVSQAYIQDTNNKLDKLYHETFMLAKKLGTLDRKEINNKIFEYIIGRYEELGKILKIENGEIEFISAEDALEYPRLSIFVTSLDYLFYGTEYETLDISNLCTCNVASMQYTFANMHNLRSINFGKLNTSKVTNITGLFYSCNKLRRLDLSKLDTSNIRRMASTFADCAALQEINLKSFNTSNVTCMSNMFSNCTSLESLDLSNFTTENLKIADSMFSNCSSLLRLDICQFQVNKGTRLSQFLYKCRELEDVKFHGSFKQLNNTLATQSMFTECKEEIIPEWYCEGTHEVMAYIQDEDRRNRMKKYEQQ